MRINRRSAPITAVTAPTPVNVPVNKIPVTPSPASTRRGPFKSVATVLTREHTREVIRIVVENREASREASDAENTIKRYKVKVHSPKTAIRAKCIECSGGSVKEVQQCVIVNCALHPFRMGENPFNKKTMRRLTADAGKVENDTEDEGDDD